MLRSIVRNHWAAVLVTALTLTGVPTLALAHTGTTHIVEISEDGFSPNHIEILAGDSVEFVNTGQLDHWPASNVHPTHELSPDFDARRPILPGGSWTFTVFRAGLWGFHDHLNPQNMGQVVVLPDTHQGSVTQSEPAGEITGTGLVRVYNAARLFVTRIFDAAKLFVSEAFARSVASNDSAPSAAPGQLNTEFRPPPDADLETVYQQVDTECASDDFDCFEGYFPTAGNYQWP